MWKMKNWCNLRLKYMFNALIMIFYHEIVWSEKWFLHSIFFIFLLCTSWGEEECAKITFFRIKGILHFCHLWECHCRESQKQIFKKNWRKEDRLLSKNWSGWTSAFVVAWLFDAIQRKERAPLPFLWWWNSLDTRV